MVVSSTTTTPQKGFIFVSGGVMSSLGKGLAAASLGALLQARGFKVCLRKLDLYLNVDPGTLSPYQHGEVFVMEDGTEADLDFGHYERYTGYVAKSADYLTSGRVYETLIQKERRGDFLGATVQVIPHVTNTIKSFITSRTGDVDFVIIEIGGTVGDIEGAPFLEAVRQLRCDLGASRTMFVHLTYLPYVKTAGELKTKPTQHSVKDLLHAGIQPDLLLCRCEIPLSQSIRNKLALFCNVTPENVVAAQDVKDIYRVPQNYSSEKFDERVCLHFGLDPHQHPLSDQWQSKWAKLTHNIEQPKQRISVAVVGKYVELEDAYKSLKEALIHAGAATQTGVDIRWCHSEKSSDIVDEIRTADAILVPGGFGPRGVDNKIRAIQFARENNIPFFGICLGMQLAIVEAFRNVAHWADADSTEFAPQTEHPVISLISEWIQNDGSVAFRNEQMDLGGTLRLGSYPCVLEKDSLAFKAYGEEMISERHRHRFEFNNPSFGQFLGNVGLRVTGWSPNGKLAEVVERVDHPWFLAVQFHPEFKSRPLGAHPLFVSFVQAALKHQLRL